MCTDASQNRRVFCTLVWRCIRPRALVSARHFTPRRAVQAVLDAAMIGDVVYSPGTKKLIVVLRDSCSRSDLEVWLASSVENM